MRVKILRDEAVSVLEDKTNQEIENLERKYNQEIVDVKFVINTTHINNFYTMIIHKDKTWRGKPNW